MIMLPIPSTQQLLDRINELELQLQLITKKNQIQTPESLSQLTSELQDRLTFIQTLFDTIPNPVFYKNVKGIYLGCNKTFGDLILGIAPEELIGRSLYNLPEVIPKHLADIYYEQDQKLFNNPGIQIYETQVNCADSNVRDFIFYKSTYLDHEGKVAGLLGLMLDITDRKKIQKNLEESEEKYRSMMESMSDAVYICRSDLTIEYMNPKMIEQIGYDATGQLCHEALHNLHVRCPWCVFQKVINGETLDQEVQSRHDGRTYVVTNSPIHHQDGSVSKMTIYHDITSRKKMENELLLAKKIESTGVFASGIAHDYNNLLLTILGNILMVRQVSRLTPDSPASVLLLEAENATKTASQLTKRLLAFTHGEALTFEKCSISDCLKKVLELYQIDNSCTVELNYCSELKSVYLEIGLFTIVLRSVLDNAKEAIETTGGTITITVTSIDINDESSLYRQRLIEKNGEYIEIKIKDNGGGISKEIQHKVFDPYFSTKQRGAQKGLGLGLATSYSIIKKHSGHIMIQQKDVPGTTVTIFLPTWAPQTISSNNSVTPIFKKYSTGQTSQGDKKNKSYQYPILK
ncbi:MAG: PAS domain S-box-containing protein [Desulforhopalus sp.]|jgi:PAS domain S-box-containing protein